MFDQLSELVGEYERLGRELADPAVHSDQAKARALGRRYAELTPVVQAYQEWAADDRGRRYRQGTGGRGFLLCGRG